MKTMTNKRKFFHRFAFSQVNNVVYINFFGIHKSDLELAHSAFIAHHHFIPTSRGFFRFFLFEDFTSKCFINFNVNNIVSSTKVNDAEQSQK